MKSALWIFRELCKLKAQHENATLEDGIILITKELFNLNYNEAVGFIAETIEDVRIHESLRVHGHNHQTGKTQE